MTKVHEGMAYKTFVYPFIGGDTYAFGDLREAYAMQEAAKAMPSGGGLFGFG